MSKRVMISAGEVSGELYGALLTRAIRNEWPDAEITGIGGDRMKKEGVDIIASISGTIGLTEAVMHIGKAIKNFMAATKAISSLKPDVLVLIDYPDFNLALAKKAKKAGVPILYYVSPQVWAWRSGRINKIASLVDRMAVLLPFEAALYKKTGLPCEFVGHPIIETINIDKTREELTGSLGLPPNKKVIALLPGSRHAEIKRHEQLIIEIAWKIHNQFPDIQVVVPLVSGTSLSNKLPEHITVLYDRTREVLACAEAAAVASGTVTLETALLQTPMTVFYKVSSVTYLLAQVLVSVKFVSLVNILSQKEVVREFVQKRATAENIFQEIKKIISDNAYRQGMKTELQKISEIMKHKTPSHRVASIVGEMAGWNLINA